MLIIINFDWGVDAATDLHVVTVPVRAGDSQGQVLLWFQAGAESKHMVSLSSVQFKNLGRNALFKLQWQHAHSYQVGTMYALEALRNDAADAQQRSAFC